MKRFSIAAIIMIVVGTLVITSVAWTQPGGARQTRQAPDQKGAMRLPRGKGPDGNMGIRLNLAEVDLSEEQKAQMQENRREFQISTAELHQKLQFAEQDLRAEMRKEPVDQAKIADLWNTITSLKQQLDDAEINQMVALRRILTPEQVETLQKSEESMQALHELRTELRDLLLAPEAPDPGKLKQIQKEITAKEIALQKERMERIAEKVQSLTPEQRQQMQTFRGNRQR